MPKVNEYGAALDRAGYAPSIMQTVPRGRTCCCYLCGRPAGYNKLDRHEPWGAANRRKSMEHGLWVLLCHEGCHDGPGSVPGGNGEAARQLRADAQTAAMLRYGWSREKWIAEFGKSELDEAECAALLPSQSRSARQLPQRGSREGAGTSTRAAALIRELWPERQTTTRSGFRLIDGPDLPY